MARFERSGAETLGRVDVTNRGDTVAFLVNLGVKKGATGDEAAPAYWDDNYVILLPGEKRQFTVRVNSADLDGAEPVASVDWWNKRR